MNSKMRVCIAIRHAHQDVYVPLPAPKIQYCQIKEEEEKKETFSVISFRRINDWHLRYLLFFGFIDIQYSS